MSLEHHLRLVLAEMETRRIMTVPEINELMGPHKVGSVSFINSCRNLVGRTDLVHTCITVESEKTDGVRLVPFLPKTVYDALAARIDEATASGRRFTTGGDSDLAEFAREEGYERMIKGKRCAFLAEFSSMYGYRSVTLRTKETNCNCLTKAGSKQDCGRASREPSAAEPNIAPETVDDQAEDHLMPDTQVDDAVVEAWESLSDGSESTDSSDGDEPAPEEGNDDEAAIAAALAKLTFINDGNAGDSDVYVDAMPPCVDPPAPRGSRAAVLAAEHAAQRGTVEMLSAWSEADLAVAAARLGATVDRAAERRSLLDHAALVAHPDAFTPLRYLHIELWQRRFPLPLVTGALESFHLCESTAAIDAFLEQMAPRFYPFLNSFPHDVRHDVCLFFAESAVTVEDLHAACRATLRRYHPALAERYNPNDAPSAKPPPPSPLQLEIAPNVDALLKLSWAQYEVLAAAHYEQKRASFRRLFGAEPSDDMAA